MTATESQMGYRSSLGLPSFNDHNNDPSTNRLPSLDSWTESPVTSPESSLASASPQGDSRNLEEDNDSGIDLEDLLSKTPACNMCGHIFYSCRDFINHCRLHFQSGNKSKAEEEGLHGTGRVGAGANKKEADTRSGTPRQHDSFAGTRQVEPPPYPHAGQQRSVNSQAKQQPKADQPDSLRPKAQQDTYHAALSKQAGRPRSQADSGLADLQRFGLQVPQADTQQQQFPLAAPFGFNINFAGGPYLPQVPYTLPQYGVLPHQAYKCVPCGATFEQREALLYHLKFHKSYLESAAGVHQEVSAAAATAAGSRGAKRHKAQHHHAQVSPPSSYLTPPLTSPPPPEQCSPKCSCSRHKQAKRQKQQVEDIDKETLERIKALEWETKHGYWCNKCKKRFSSRALLVDHMSYSSEHSYNAKSDGST